MHLFKSFFLGGYECADLINKERKRVDLLALTGHHNRVDEDYALLEAAGIRTVREGIRWSVVEKVPGRYDFSEVKNRIMAGQRAGIQQLWDMCHFGYPDGLHPLHPAFATRLVNLCKAFTQLYQQYTNDPLIITPVNEISFLSYLSGEVAGTIPFLENSAGHIKYHLCQAVIRAVEAIKSSHPAAKILMVEPLIRVHAERGKDTTPHIENYNAGQFEAMDIITGQLFPELGGQPCYMDLAGFNYYYNNQWHACGQGICWKSQQAFLNFPGLLKGAADRYGKPVVLTETGHFDTDRSLWIQHITGECISAMKAGVNLQGICIYPVIDRPDWDNLQKYIPCGIWGYHPNNQERLVEFDYLSTIKSCIAAVEAYRRQPVLTTAQTA